MLEFDKLLHFVVGFILTSGLLLMGFHWTITTAILLGVAYAKEIYDEVSYGGFCLRDIIATMIGGLIPLIIYNIF